MTEHMLEIQNLLIEAEIEGAWKPIVNGLSLNLKKGEIVGLIGESGAGKSTPKGGRVHQKMTFNVKLES